MSTALIRRYPSCAASQATAAFRARVLPSGATASPRPTRTRPRSHRGAAIHCAPRRWPRRRGGRRIRGGRRTRGRPDDRPALLGPDGAGKSTLLAVAASHLEPTRGTVTWRGRNPAARRNLTTYRKAVAWLPQQNVSIPGLTVREQVAHARLVQGHEPLRCPVRVRLRPRTRRPERPGRTPQPPALRRPTAPHGNRRSAHPPQRGHPRTGPKACGHSHSRSCSLQGLSPRSARRSSAGSKQSGMPPQLDPKETPWPMSAPIDAVRRWPRRGRWPRNGLRVVVHRVS
ncbi:ATP-binding cassette domain-containing protein [Streptomyces sp. SP18CS02]|nr:ATP-binding cassette domain-containing protein [Streptomyces sp. SP18CS02]